MKHAILADIHANLEAFQAVLVDARESGCTHHAFLGDIVGHCADPQACLDLVRAMGCPCVKGNHDEYCSADSIPDGFNPKAAKLVEWTRQQLTEEDRGWLRALPYVKQVEDFTLVHATLDAPQSWAYVFDKRAAAASFVHQNTVLCFFGHTHVPLAFIRNTVLRGGTFTRFAIEPGKQYFVNAGAVGQPRDNNPKAAYVIYDCQERTVELRRVAYDIETARKKIKQAGLG